MRYCMSLLHIADEFLQPQAVTHLTSGSPIFMEVSNHGYQCNQAKLFYPISLVGCQGWLILPSWLIYKY